MQDWITGFNEPLVGVETVTINDFWLFLQKTPKRKIQQQCERGPPVC